MYGGRVGIQEWKKLLFQLEHEWLKELEGVVSKTTTAKKEVNRWVWKGENSSHYLVKTTYKAIMANKRGVKDAGPSTFKSTIICLDDKIRQDTLS